MATRKTNPAGSGDQDKPAARRQPAKPRTTSSTKTPPAAKTTRAKPAAAKTPTAETKPLIVRSRAARLEREANPLGRSTPALGKGLSKTERAIGAAERANKAMRLRAMRVPWLTIAEQCGYSSRGAAATAVKRELMRIPREAARELRTSELETLDIAQRAMSAQIMAGNFAAIDRMLRIMDARAKLTGLYENIADTGVDEVKQVLGAWLGQVIKLDAADDQREGENDDD